MPAHSSHILQPLDVGYFSPLKIAYGMQIEGLMQAHVTLSPKKISSLHFMLRTKPP